MKRYFTVLGIVLLAITGVAFVTRPDGAGLERAVNEAHEAYTKAGRQGALAQVRSRDTLDFLVGAMHTLKLENGKTFRCTGAFKVTVCTAPEPGE